MSNIHKILEVMAALRDRDSGCPWDLEQTFATIAPYTVEEAYEVADAIAREDLGDLRDELGDLLFQVVFHARMAEEQGAFDFAAVVEAISAKMIRRHPHVFAAGPAVSARSMPATWEAHKARERGPVDSVLDGVALALPALARAAKLGKRAAGVGFDWPDATGVHAKIDEELAELRACDDDDRDALTEELGDLLFSVANLARHYGVDPEAALGAANRKFERRFRGVEKDLGLGADGATDASLAHMEAAWRRQKARE